MLRFILGKLKEKETLISTIQEEACFKLINKVCPEMHREDGLIGYIDDLDFIEILMEVEVTFGCVIEEDKVVDDFNTVGDLSKWLAEKTK